MEFHVNAVVATVPSVCVFGIDAEGLFSRLQIEELFDIRKVVAKRRLGTFDPDIVRVQTSGLVGRGQCRVAKNKGCLTGKFIDGIVALVALMDQLSTTRDGFLHAFVDGIVEYFDSVRVVHAHFRVPFVLFLGVGCREKRKRARERNKVRYYWYRPKGQAKTGYYTY